MRGVTVFSQDFPVTNKDICPKRGCGVLAVRCGVVGLLMGERSRARAEGTGKDCQTKGPVHENTCKSWAKRRGAKLIVCLGGLRPPRQTFFISSAFCPRLAGVFVHWALGLGGLASALGARPAALTERQDE